MTDEQLRRRINRFKESPRLKGDSWMYYENWLKGKALTTQVEYLWNVIGFLEWLDKNTEELYELYLGMIRNDDPRNVMRMGMLLVEYQKHLMASRGIKGSSTHVVLSAVKGFFKANALPLELTEKSIKQESVETPNISLEQLSKVLSSTGSYKNKAYIKVGRDSGLRTGDITHLPIRVVRAALDDPSIEFHTFEWKTRKTGQIANPVLGPDCLEAIRTWMNYRVNALGLSAEDGDLLFCVEKSCKEYTDKLGRYNPELVRGKLMDDGSMSVCFRQIVRKAGLKPLTGNTRLPTFHSLRVFHKTTLEYAGVPTSWINKMQGRKGEGTGGTYSKPNPEELIAVYKKGYAALSGIEEGQQEKVDSLTQELGISQYELAELRKERDKYRADYDLRSRLQSIIDKARLDGDLPEELIKKLEEKLESTETFEEGVTLFHKLKEENKLEDEQSENWDFKMVDEEAEMILNASEGWEVFKALNDGRYVLRRKLSDM